MYQQTFLNTQNLKHQNFTAHNLTQFIEDIQTGKKPAFSVALQTDDLPQLQKLATHIQNTFDHVVVLGIGGSSLGAQVLVHFHQCVHQTKTHIHFVDNVDPQVIDHLKTSLPLNKTCVLSVSKSGGTIETVLQTQTFLDAFLDAKLDVAKHFIGIYEPGDRPLRNMLETYGCEILEHDANIGGRFSVLSVVGMLPALIAGMPVEKVRQGAAQVLQIFLNNPQNVAAYEGAQMAVAAQQAGLNNAVCMPYGDKLRPFPLWFVQLWAESLGKQNKGSTPVAAVGSTDQHSALQAFLDGANTNYYTVIQPNTSGIGQKISFKNVQNIDREFATLGDVLYAQCKATVDALAHKNRAVRVVEVENLDEKALGALLMHYMLETAIAAHIWQIDAFDQPAVEDGKKRAVEYLQK